MNEPLQPAEIELHIRAALRPRSESGRVLCELLDHCWPAGVRDRLEPLARGWLLAWGPELVAHGPTGAVVQPPECGCRLDGHCTVCN